MAKQQLLLIYDSDTKSYVDYSHLVSYKVDYNKLWSSDSGRDLNGDNKATLIGIFPKLEITTGTEYADHIKWTKAQVQQLLKLANKSSVKYKYYDEEYDCMCECPSGYFNDVPIELSKSNTERMRYKAFSFNIIPNTKRKESWKV